VLNKSFISGVGLAVPKNFILQQDYREKILSRELTREKKRYLEKILNDSGISKRHSILDLHADGSINYKSDNLDNLTTSHRNSIFIKEVIPLATKAAKDCFNNSTVKPEEITHLITVSCTGFSNPGFDFPLINNLKISSTINRYNIGFMGCYGAFPGIELADSICRANPEAKVLCICAELCSLHFSPNQEYDDLLAATIFADGAAAVIVTGESNMNNYQNYSILIKSYDSIIINNSQDKMAWSIGDYGFSLILSNYVSKIIGSNIDNILNNLWFSKKIRPDYFLVHPGGKSILDRVENSLNFIPDVLNFSRKILFDFGNMSSATILFVLNNLINNSIFLKGETIGLLGFGPGLTVKSILLEIV
jgi:predicted naringenin-chalcone synthase